MKAWIQLLLCHDGNFGYIEYQGNGILPCLERLVIHPSFGLNSEICHELEKPNVKQTFFAHVRVFEGNSRRPFLSETLKQNTAFNQFYTMGSLS